MKPRIHYELSGNGPTTVVICNGLSQSTANWRGIARSNPQLRWLLFDARGCGKSPLGQRPYSINDHAEDLFWVLDQAGVDQAYLLGFSHGGRVACRAVASQADRFKGLLLVSVGSELTIRRRAHIQAWHQTLKLGGVRAMAWASLPNIVGSKILEKFGDWDMLVNGTANRNSEQGLLAMFEGMATYPPIKEDAVLVRLPTLILRGGEDPLVDQKDGRQLCEWTLGKEEVFEDCAHTLPLEESEQFVQAVSRFIDCVDKGLPF